MHSVPDIMLGLPPPLRMSNSLAGDTDTHSSCKHRGSAAGWKHEQLGHLTAAEDEHLVGRVSAQLLQAYMQHSRRPDHAQHAKNFVCVAAATEASTSLVGDIVTHGSRKHIGSTAGRQHEQHATYDNSFAGSANSCCKQVASSTAGDAHRNVLLPLKGVTPSFAASAHSSCNPCKQCLQITTAHTPSHK
jgi:hypothetical protein